MLAVPSHKEITFVERRDGQVQRISGGICWHHSLLNVACGNVRDRLFDGQDWQITNQRQSLGTSFGDSGRQLVNHRRTGEQFVFCGCSFPPLPSPVPASNNVRSGSQFVIEARNRGFDVNTRPLHECKIPFGVPHQKSLNSTTGDTVTSNVSPWLCRLYQCEWRLDPHCDTRRRVRCRGGVHPLNHPHFAIVLAHTFSLAHLCYHRSLEPHGLYGLIHAQIQAGQLTDARESLETLSETEWNRRFEDEVRSQIEQLRRELEMAMQ